MKIINVIVKSYCLFRFLMVLCVLLSPLAIHAMLTVKPLPGKLYQSLPIRKQGGSSFIRQYTDEQRRAKEVEIKPITLPSYKAGLIYIFKHSPLLMRIVKLMKFNTADKWKKLAQE